MARTRIFFIAAFVLMLLAVLGEWGAGTWVVRPPSWNASPQEQQRRTDSLASSVRTDPPVRPEQIRARVTAPGAEKKSLETPGYGIRSLALLDALMLVAIGLFLLAVLIPGNVHAKIQGVISGIASLLVILGSLIAAFAAVALVFVMIGLLLAVPFGTIAYLAVWGDFPRGAAAVTLGILMTMKLAAFACVAIGRWQAVDDKKLVLLALTVLLANVLVGFLHGFPPGILASITDVVGAIVVAILAIVWGVIFLIFAILSVVNVLISAAGRVAPA